MVFIMVLPYFHIFIMMAIKDAHIKEKVDTIVNVNQSLYEIFVMYVSLYDYVLTKGATTLKGKPINQMWENLYETRAGSESFFSTLLISVQKDDSYDEPTKKNITKLISGNLCEMLTTNVGNVSRCPIVMAGSLKKGIQSASSYNLYTLRSLKTYFDLSAKTTNDMKITLNSPGLLAITTSMRSWQYWAYEQLGTIFGKSTQRLVTLTKDKVDDLLAIYLVLYILVVTSLAYGIKRTMRRRFTLWMRMLRKVPIDIIMSNKQLKSLIFQRGSQFTLIELEE